MAPQPSLLIKQSTRILTAFSQHNRPPHLFALIYQAALSNLRKPALLVELLRERRALEHNRQMLRRCEGDAVREEERACTCPVRGGVGE